MKAKIIIGLMILIVVLSACQPKTVIVYKDPIAAGTPPPRSLSSDGIPSTVTRFIDPKYNNVCYLYEAGYRGGISCVPLEKD
jgi:hypothetical protein